MFKPTVLSNFVSEKDNARLLEIINEKESAGLLGQTTTGDVKIDGRHMLWNEQDPEWWGILRPYIKKIIDGYGNPNLVPHDIAMLKYYPGPGMGLHSDQDCPCAGMCHLTSVIYLNDDYDGGEVVFPWIAKEYKLNAREAMVFPQHEKVADHAIKPIKSGNRYAIITCYSEHKEMLRPFHADFYLDE